VLPASVAGDTERLARFQREAEVLAALNHPNIAQIHGLDKSGGTIALVMELVDGPTLADRITHGAIPVDEALPVAKQIAEALAEVSVLRGRMLASRRGVRAPRFPRRRQHAPPRRGTVALPLCR
jgi:serine/threonine protein kinase